MSAAGTLRRDVLKIRRRSDLGGIELHWGTAVTRAYPRHWHDEYSLCAIEKGGGTLDYRGAAHHTPAGCLFIVHPGEVHANRADARAGCTYRNLYFSPGLMQSAAAQATGRASTPFFSNAVSFHKELIRGYFTLHTRIEAPASRLEQETRLLEFLVLLLRHGATERPLGFSFGRERAAVQRVRDYLADHCAENVSLGSLACLASLSPFHLNRVFRAEIGMPPHAFQTQLRVVRAKGLLDRGWKISAAAAAAGFADQSHFTRHFKRVVGIPPGEYRRGLGNLNGADARP